MSERSLVLVGGDLMARARIESAAGDAGFSVEVKGPGAIDEVDAEVVILDLDQGGPDLVQAWRRRGSQARAIGYFSHVDESLGETARAAGIEALPRGRFWRTLPEILANV